MKTPCTGAANEGRARRPAILALLLVLTAAGAARAEDAPDLRAPAGCWTAEGGGPARTGSAATAPVVGDLEPAWTFDVPGGGRMETEPRVWRDRVIVAVAGADGKRTLHVLRLADGKPIAPPLAFPTSPRLEPSVHEDRVLVRAAPGRLEIHTLTGGTWRKAWTGEGTGTFHSPLLVGRDVFAREDGDVVAWLGGARAPSWRVHGVHRGRLAAAEGTVYVLSYDEAFNASLLPIEARTGTPGHGAFVGHHGTSAATPEADLAAIVVLPTQVFVQHATPVRTQEGIPLRTSRVRRRAAPGIVGLEPEGLFDFAEAPVGSLAAWLVQGTDEKGGHELQLWREGEKGPVYWSLAHRSSHPEFLEGAASVAGPVAYVGRRALHLETLEILWDGGVAPAFRPVPARDTLLVAPTTGRLEALRPRRGAGSRSLFLGAAAPATPPEEDDGSVAGPPLDGEGRVLLDDGTIHRGAFRLDAGAGAIELVTGKKRAKRDLVAARVVLGTDGRLLYARTEAEASEAISDLLHRDHADEFLRLAKDAWKANDPASMLGWLEEAADRGTPEKDLEFPRKQQRDLAAKGPKTSAEAVAKLRERERTLLASEEEALLATLRGALADSRPAVRRAFLERVLAASPKDPEAAAVVRAALPAWMPVPATFEPREWVGVADALRRSRARPVVAPTGESKDLTRQQRELGSALHTWRKDLVGFETDDLLVLTPLAAPERIAACVSLGELVCHALEAVFAGGKHVRTDPWPMSLRLYETKEEYLAESDKAGAMRRERLELTAGHYDAEAGVSRIFLPPGRDAYERAMGTYAHELTHHWIEQRCPLFLARDVRPSADQPGYWIVEGMAEMVGQFRWDLANRTWETLDPRGEALDSVVNAPRGALHAWERLYRMSGADFDRLDGKTEVRIPRRWQLAHKSVTSPFGLFYTQATATCLYLWHQGDASREALLDYVRAWYTGGIAPGEDSIKVRFGMSGRELGERVEAWAKSVLR